MEVQLSIKHGPTEVPLSCSTGSTVLDIKQQLQQNTGVFVRNQKLIYKGRVLEDSKSLECCKIGQGAKLMLLATEGLPVKGQPAPNRPATSLAKAVTAAATRRNSAADEKQGSSLLSEKMKDMAAVQAAARSSDKASWKALKIGERRAAWDKTGVLALRDMQLIEIQQDWLEGLTAIKAADISYNQLSALPTTLMQLSSISSLKLNDNCLQDAGMPWQQLCSGLQCLSTLLLGHNQLSHVPSCISQLTRLVTLGLEDNQLQQIEAGALASLTKLQVLQLRSNRLQQLPDDIGSCSNLVAVNAGCNALAALPDSMTKLGKLQVLVVDNNRLSALPARLLSGCSSLCTLNAHHNPLTVGHLRAAEGYQVYETRRQARATKQLEGRVLADIDKSFSEGADVEQWQRWMSGPTGLGSDGSGRAAR